jgi:excisionase family DNA binding protein
MTSTETSPAANVVVDVTERRQAGELLASIDGHPERLLSRDEELPELAQLLATVVEVLALGGSITISPLPEELTTTVAANQLGISRPTLMKLIRAGTIPARLAGTHHRVKLSDVRAYQRIRLEEQRRAFEELRALSDDLGDI